MGYFLIGAVFTLCINTWLCGTMMPMWLDSLLSALVSLVGGVVSAMSVAWLQRRWQKKGG